MAAEAAVALAASPVEPGEFGTSMKRFAPFEAQPELAIAVSGGPDSMALACLAHEWAAGGRVRGVIVDHRLRAESADEAHRTARWLSEIGIEAVVLRWDGAKPATGIQEAAREARYTLLEDWCRRNGVLHLLVGHHADDQWETAAHRASRGSGPDGLAGMSAVVERPDLRILRPLLAFSKARLVATLVARGRDWIEDPTNLDPAFARGRLRTAPEVRAPSELRLRALGRERCRAEAETAHLMAAAVRLAPAGFAQIDPATLRGAPADAARRALAAVLRTVAGAAYPPPSAQLEAIADAVLAGDLGGGRTVAGCRVVPHGDGLLICREASAVAPPCPVRRAPMSWDGRYVVAASEDARFTVHALGRVRPGRDRSPPPVPGPARPALPAFSDDAGLAMVPHLGWRRTDLADDAVSARSAPRWALAGAGFATLDVVLRGP